MGATHDDTEGRDALRAELEAGRRHHDLGGRPAGPVDRAQHEHEPWENRTDAIVRLLSAPERGPVMRIDELRRGIEELGPGVYDTLTYYERWIASVTNILIEKGVLTVDEVGDKLEAVRARRAEAPPRREGRGGGTV